MQLKFKSLNGTLYTLQIGAGNGQLIGAAEPFTINEDSSDDFFKSVRLQSGYIRIVDDGTNSWRSLIPYNATSTKVTLSGDASWVGFLSVGTYGAPYPDRPDVIEMPVVCPLTVLSGYSQPAPPISNNTPNYTPTFAEIIDYIMEDAGAALGDDLGYRFIPDLADSQDLNNMLSIKVQWSTFLEYDGEGNLVRTKNDLQLLESICQFLGLSCRMSNGSVIFTAVDMLANDYSGWNDIDCSDGFNFADTNSTEHVISGLGEVNVKCDLNKKDNLLSVPFEKIADDNYPTSTVSLTREYYNETDKFVSYLNECPRSYTFENLSISYHMNAYINNFMMRDWINNFPQDYNPIAEGNWSAFLETQVGDGDEGYIEFKTDIPVYLKDGWIKINGNLNYVIIKDHKLTTWTPKYGQIYAALIVGDMMWQQDFDSNGNPNGVGSWVSLPSQIPDNAPIGTKLICSNGSIFYGTAVDDGTGIVGIEDPRGIPIPRTGLFGVVRLLFYCLDQNIAMEQHYQYPLFDVHGLTISYRRGNYNNKTSSYYKKSNSSIFQENKEITVDYISDTRRIDYGTNLLINNNPNIIPEYILCNRIANFHSQPRRMLNITIQNIDGIGSIDPETRIIAPDNENYYPLSISRDYWNEKITVKLIQL